MNFSQVALIAAGIVGEKRVDCLNERAKKNNKIGMINIQNTMCEKKKKHRRPHVPEQRLSTNE